MQMNEELDKKYLKKIVKYTINKNVGTYELALPRSSKFLFNDRNVLYFEESITEREDERQFGKLIFHVVSENDGYDYIPNYYDYLCTFKDNANIRYFVYIETSISKMFGKFFNDFNLV